MDIPQYENAGFNAVGAKNFSPISRGYRPIRQMVHGIKIGETRRMGKDEEIDYPDQSGVACSDDVEKWIYPNMKMSGLMP